MQQCPTLSDVVATFTSEQQTRMTHQDYLNSWHDACQEWEKEAAQARRDAWVAMTRHPDYIPDIGEPDF